MVRIAQTRLPPESSMATNSSADANGGGAGGDASSPVLDERERLRAARSYLFDLWRAEVQSYERSVLDLTDYDVRERATRNRPNPGGIVEDPALFPYHPALYPLLDCYDSIRDNGDDAGEVARPVRPSPAPLPFQHDGHRRSRFGPRLDRYGIQIQELATLQGHLPNSAWAVMHTLMPRDRREQFEAFREAAASSDDDGRDGGVEPHVGDLPPLPPQQNNARFWDRLTNPVSEAAPPIAFDEISIPPEQLEPEPELEDLDGVDAADEEEGDDGIGSEGGEGGYEEGSDAVDGEGEWEDYDEEEDEDEPVLETEPLTAAETEANARNARDFAFLRWWQREIVRERRGAIDPRAGARDEAAPCRGRSAPEGIRSEGNGSAAFVLLKVLKHSLSDLQREHRLARAVALLLADWRLCDDDGGTVEGGRGSSKESSEESNDSAGIECLRGLLTVVSSEYLAPCGGHCHEWYLAEGGDAGDDDDEFEDVDNPTRLDAPNHYCSDWWDFLGSLSTLISFGITNMTRRHANVLCAFVMEEINRASTGAGPADGVGDENGELAGKAYLKQNIYFLNNAEYDAFGRPSEGVPQDGAGCQLNVNLLLAIASAVREHAVSDRMRLIKLLSRNDKGGDDQSEILNSFQACVDILVDIGERCLLRLPTNNSGRQLGGMIVRGLVESYVSSDNLSAKKEMAFSYLAQESNGKCRSVIDPRRYADAVANSSSHPLLDPKRSTCQKKTDPQSIEHFIGSRPPKDVIDIVKGLFMRDLVDLQVSGCGYGDWLSWCNLPISPEPLLFDFISNFPNLSREGDPGEPQNSNTWVVDEDGTELDQSSLSARYDFSLLVFLRQWHSPWTPESVPHDISIHVNSFLPRSWWPDDRRSCWCRDCQLNQLKAGFKAKIASRQSNWSKGGEKALSSLVEDEKKKSPTLMTCPGCHVAMACSKDHLKYLHQDGHKRYCGLPPFRAPFSEEDDNLCRQIFGGKEDASDVENDHGENESEQGAEIDEEHEDDWESVDSNEEAEGAEQSRSETILAFFDDKSYRLQRREAPPFANFF
ncbi:hypothetical protein ACHAWF_017831 [Thalassiosira exigua]